MRKTTKDLREERGVLAKEIQALADVVNGDDKRAFDAGEQEKWEKVNAAYDEASASIKQSEIYERGEAVHADQTRIVNDPGVGRDDYNGRDAAEAERAALSGDAGGAITDEDRDLALEGWCLRQMDKDVAERQSLAANRCNINLNRRELDIDLRTDYRRVRHEYRAQSVGTDTAGGFLRPEGFVPNLEHSLLAFGGVRQVASVMRTGDGGDLPWPTVDDTSNSGVLLTENSAVSEQDVTFGQVVFKAYKYSSKLVRVSLELLQDSAFNMANELGDLLGIRLARITNTHFTTGDGSSKPKGIVTSASTGITTATNSAILGDELVGMVHSVDPAYRAQPGAGWMMHDNILLAIRKLKTTDLQYIWAPGLVGAEPDRLLGYPITINQAMDSATTSAKKVAIFGALAKYKIRDVASIRLRRLVERYADNDQEGFVAFMRVDGQTLDAGTDPIKILLMKT